MIAGSLARRYARALFSVGEAKNSFEKLGSEVSVIAEMFDTSNDLQLALTSPSFSGAQRRGVLEALLTKLNATKDCQNFLLLLLQSERLEYLPSIARELRAMVDDKLGRVRAQISSARELPANDTKELQSALEKATGKTVDMEVTIDADLLGGVVAKVGDIVYDGSIRTQLERMRERFSL